jgi:hypothetical protein
MPVAGGSGCTRAQQPMITPRAHPHSPATPFGRAMAVIKSNSTVADATQWAGSKKQWTSGSAIGLDGACVDKKWSTWVWQRQKQDVL